MAFEKQGEDLFQRSILPARESAKAPEGKPPARDLDDRERRLGPADVPGQHPHATDVSKSAQWKIGYQRSHVSRWRPWDSLVTRGDLVRLFRGFLGKKIPRVGVGPPGERKEDVEVLVSSSTLGLQGPGQTYRNAYFFIIST
jgi:hypothetical protein